MHFKIEQRSLLICEGEHDVEFFSNLIVTKGLPPFQVVRCGAVAGVKRGGIDCLTDALDALPSLPGFFETLETVLIAADNDSNPTVSFQHVQALISKATDNFGENLIAPNAPLQKIGSNPTITVVMIPWNGVPGALDTLCYKAASAKRAALSNSVEQFALAAKVNVDEGWEIHKQDKMKLRCLISAAHKKNPILQPAWVWRENTDLVPLDDPVFNEISDFLKNFPDIPNS